MASNTPRIDQIAAGRNLAINGGFDLWQRGTSTTIANAIYLADRFRTTNNVTSLVGTQTQSADVPSSALLGGSLVNFSSLITATTGATPGSLERFMYETILEGYDYAPMHGGQQVTLQFAVKAGKTGAMGILINGGTNRAYITSVTINAANTWELKRVSFLTDTTSGWATTNGNSFNVHFVLSAGAGALTAQTEQWITRVNEIGPVGQTNFTSTNGDTVRFTAVQIIQGSTDGDLPFRRAGANFAHELELAKRYFEAYTTTGQLFWPLINFGANDVNFQVFCTEKRDIPVVTLVGTQNTDFLIGAANGGSSQTGFVFTASLASTRGVTITGTKTTHGLTAAFLRLFTSGSFQFNADF